MDPTRAKAMVDELRGKTVGGWTVGELAGFGKSAVVFEAEKNGTTAALKVFDRELVERFGADTQRVRLKRELRLIGHGQPHLVQIFDGGEEPQFGGLMFIVMELLKHRNLFEVLDKVPRDRIRPLVAQVASAAKYLESRELCHRDIKPDNIAVTADFETAILLDLGVVRPFGTAKEAVITDLDQLQFVGTLQYASPEFLTRTEEDSPDGWRALTYYQLGAVLHDLLMRRRIFADDAAPFAKLVMAVRDQQPHIEADDVPADLVLLAKNCLQKDPHLRLRFVDWDSFSPDPPQSSADNIRKRIRQRLGAVGPQHQQADWQAQREVDVALRDLSRRIHNAVRNECLATGLTDATIREVLASESSEAFILVQFAPSTANFLRGVFELGFRVVLIDRPSLALRIEAAAALTSEPVDFTKNASTVQVFEGTFEDAAVRAVLSDNLLAAFDAAQELDVADGAKWILGSAASVVNA